jgi:hypothetical protein
MNRIAPRQFSNYNGGILGLSFRFTSVMRVCVVGTGLGSGDPLCMVVCVVGSGLGSDFVGFGSEGLGFGSGGMGFGP